jgi:hypothetical protein
VIGGRRSVRQENRWPRPLRRTPTLAGIREI